MSEHKLVGNTLYNERDGIIGKCTCGWTTGHRITGMIASNAFSDHKEEMEARRASEQGGKQDDPLTL